MTEDIILDRIPDGVDPRKPIPLGVKVAVLLRMLGLTSAVQWDHRPPLWSRKWNATKRDTVPAANDPAYINARSVEAHDTLTNGPGGERRITSAGGDTHARARCERLSKANEDFRRALLRKGDDAAEPVKPSRNRLRSGPMPCGRDSRFKKHVNGKVSAR